MRMVHVAGFDPAATAWNLSTAIAQYAPIHDSHSILRHEWVGTVPCHAHWDQSPEQCRALLDAADVVIFHCGTYDWDRQPLMASEPTWLGCDTHEYPAFKAWADPAKAVIWLDGSVAVRHNVPRWKERYQGYRICATNADVAELYGAEWVPACVSPQVETMAIPLVHDRARRVLAHPYTDVALKQHATFAAAVDRNRERWELAPVQGRAHSDCIAAMADADLIADHMRGYFGVVTLEATALGRPVLLDVSPVTVRHMAQYGWSVPSSWLSVRDTDGIDALLKSLSGAPQSLWHAYADEAEAWWCRHGSNEHRIEPFIAWLSRS